MHGLQKIFKVILVLIINTHHGQELQLALILRVLAAGGQVGKEAGVGRGVDVQEPGEQFSEGAGREALVLLPDALDTWTKMDFIFRILDYKYNKFSRLWLKSYRPKGAKS